MKIKCCGKKQSVTTYIIEPIKNVVASVMGVLNPCCVCKEFVIAIVQNMPDGSNKFFKKKGNDALKLFQKIHDGGRIICELKGNIVYRNGGWYLYYYDKGKKLKCYSNLATLRCGLSEPFQGLPQGDKKVLNGSFIR